jgi:hypothetical protein
MPPPLSQRQAPAHSARPVWRQALMLEPPRVGPKPPVPVGSLSVPALTGLLLPVLEEEVRQALSPQARASVLVPNPSALVPAASRQSRLQARPAV